MRTRPLGHDELNGSERFGVLLAIGHDLVSVAPVRKRLHGSCVFNQSRDAVDDRRPHFGKQVILMPNDKQRVADAKISFAKLMGWTVVTGILMSIVAVIFLSYTAGPLTGAMVVASVLGVFVSVVLGAGLMAVGFLSSNSGHDDNAADHRDRNNPSGR